MNTYFEYVRRHRKLLNLTQSEYAKRYGVTQGLVSAIERGNWTLPNQIAIDVAKAFSPSVSLAQLKPALEGLTFDGGIVANNQKISVNQFASDPESTVGGD